MSNLILKIRLESLITNLDQVRSLTQSVKKREDETKALRVALESTSNLIKTVNTHTGVAKLYGVGGFEESRHEFNKTMDKLEQGLQRLETEVSTAKSLLDGMKNRFVPIQGSLEFTLENELDTRTKELLKTLRITRKKVNEPDVKGGILQQAWQAACYEQDRFGFSEYVDFLSGLALRDKGWDNSICHIADELISTCGRLIPGQIWDALTIPSSRGAVTLARIIRMGFPEWTFWGLPLTAHELALLTVNTHDELSTMIEDEAGDDQQTRREIEACFADGLATYVMGPAYACAALLLRFSPSLAYAARFDAVDAETLRTAVVKVIKESLDQSETGSLDKTAVAQFENVLQSSLAVSLRRTKAIPDAERAHVILLMLDNMYGQCKTGASFDPSIIALLKDEWQEAIQQAQPSGSPGSHDRLDKWTDTLFRYLSKSTVSVMYCGTYWDWSKSKLLEIHDDDPTTLWITDKDKANDPQQAGQNVKYLDLAYSIDLRDVINAAWACRIDKLNNGDENANWIDAAASKLWTCVKEKKKSEQEVATSVRAGIKAPASFKTKK